MKHPCTIFWKEQRAKHTFSYTASTPRLPDLSVYLILPWLAFHPARRSGTNWRGPAATFRSTCPLQARRLQRCRMPPADATNGTPLLAHRASGHTGVRHLGADLAGRLAYDFPPLVRCLGRVCLELQLVAHAECVAHFPLAHILTLHIELAVCEGADDAVGQVD